MKKNPPHYLYITALTILFIISLTSCGPTQSKKASSQSKEISADLTWESGMELRYASEFSADYYKDGYRLITIAQDGRYLIVPEGKTPWTKSDSPA